MYSLQLQWLTFSVNLQQIESKFKTDYPNNYVGNQAHSCLELYFQNELTEQMRTDIQTYWDSLTEISSEVTSYVTQANINIEKENQKLSAKTKLLSLGLTNAEIEALVGR